MVKSCMRTVFEALGDSTRYKMVSALLSGERCACELPSIVGRAQPTVSLQLKRLVKTGILSARKDGKKIIYRISDARVKKLLEKK
jgi:ArsR family transcriptional regulator, lead/cadmium/zinc/bismuth-responsive transcriptional repressor